MDLFGQVFAADCTFRTSDLLDSVVIDKVGEQADNGQYAENDFSCVQIFHPISVIRKVLDGFDDEINYSADGLKDWAECNHAYRLPSINMRITIRQSSHGAG